ncbi:MAG: glycosyltransferase [Gemmatimonadetes bacterium]|nr:glycosyltransferase [Gemmatimonadota bacterium]
MSDTLALRAAAPWFIAAALIPLLLLRRSRVRRFPPPAPEAAPLVSVIVPARNEAHNIHACLATLLASAYPRFEVIVADDQSRDGTGEIVRLIAARCNGRLRLIDGAPPPPGWIGKAWACWQGYRAARGELLLFADADTRHREQLLGHAVGALQASGTDLVSVLPRQRMLTFWERVILPQLFTAISIRYHDVERISQTRRPRGAIANGQFMLFRRDSYERIGGHEAVHEEVVEDMALAQAVVEDGGRLLLAHADDLMETRMYRSLRGIIEGWTKNLAQGSRRAVPAWLAPLAPWLIALVTLAAWVVPPVLLVASIFEPLLPGVQSWALAAAGAGAACWVLVNAALRAPPQHGLVYPLGALAVALLFVRSAIRGDRVVWRERRYRRRRTSPR